MAVLSGFSVREGWASVGCGPFHCWGRFTPRLGAAWWINPKKGRLGGFRHLGDPPSIPELMAFGQKLGGTLCLFNIAIENHYF